MRKIIAVWLVIMMLIGGMIGIMSLSTDAENGNGDAEIRPASQSKSGLNPHTPIYINGISGFNATNGVSAGDGSISDPYIIENWDINASSADGIKIENTDVYFIIKNCVIHDGESNSRYGIFFFSVQNGKIDNVTSYNNYCSIYLPSSSNNTITNCDVYDNSNEGIVLYSSSNNTISDCAVYNNSHYGGVYLCYSLNNHIINCSAYNNPSGIMLWSSSSNNIITNCSVYNNSHGIYLRDLSDNNTIIGCTISNNTYEGILLLTSSYNSISNCNISSNGRIGIQIGDSSNNNTITNCTSYNNYGGIYVSCSSNCSIIYCNTSFNSACGLSISWSSGNILIGNQMWDNNEMNLQVYGIEKQHFNNSIDTSNTVNGKTAYYYYDLRNTVLEDLDSTHITLAGCANVSLVNCTVINGDGLDLSFTENSTMRKCFLSSNNWYGIHLHYSPNNTITNCNIYSNSYGIFSYYSNNSNILNCEILNNLEGIELGESLDNNIMNNSIIGNAAYAIYAYAGSDANASYNYFGTSDPTQINKLVFGDIDYSNWLVYKEVNVQYINTTIEWQNTMVLLDKPIILNGNMTLENTTLVFNNSLRQNFIQVNNNLNIINSQIKSNYGYYSILYLNHTTGSIINSNITGQRAVTIQTNTMSINNSTVSHGEVGLILISASNNVITNCKVCNNRNGIWFDQSSNNALINSDVLYSSHAITFYLSSNNTITHCNISSNTWRGICFDSSSNNIVEGCNILSNDVDGILIYSSSNNNLIIETNISASQGSGIGISSSYNNTITSCNISNHHEGISMWDTSNITITSCIISENQRCGIGFSDYSNNITIENCDILNNSIGANLGGGLNILIKDCNISSNSHMGVFVQSSVISIVNSTIIDNGLENIYMRGSIINCVNTTFINVTFTDATSILNVSWYLSVNVLWQNNASVENASVKIQGNMANEVFSGITDLDGWVRWVVIQEYTQNQTTKTYFTPYNVTASKNSISNYIIVEVNCIKEIIVILEDKISPIAMESHTGILGENNWYVSDVEINLTALDPGSGLEKIEYRINNGSWNLYIGNFTLAEDGVYFVEYRATDNVGNVEMTKNVTIQIDTTPPNAPGVSSFTHPDQALWYSKNNVSFSVGSQEEDLSGVVGYYYIFDQNASTVPTKESGTWTSNVTSIVDYHHGNPTWYLNIIGFSNVSDGIWYFHIVAKDNAGNIGNTTHRTVRIDTTPPTVTITEESQTITTTSFTMHWSTNATDIQYYEISTNGINWVNVGTNMSYTFTNLCEGTNVLYARGTDHANNTGPSSSIPIIVEIPISEEVTPSEEVNWLLYGSIIVVIFLVLMLAGIGITGARRVERRRIFRSQIVRCIYCQETIKITSRDRPLLFQCPKCGRKSVIR